MPLYSINLLRKCRYLENIVRYKIQPVLNAPLAPHLVQPLLAVAALNSVVVGTVTLSLARYVLPLLVCLDIYLLYISPYFFVYLYLYFFCISIILCRHASIYTHTSTISIHTLPYQIYTHINTNTIYIHSFSMEIYVHVCAYTRVCACVCMLCVCVCVCACRHICVYA